MTLHETIIADASAVFCNVDDFAEEVTYQPYGGSDRVIKAVVIRNQDGPYGPDEHTDHPYLTIHVENNATTGISSDELNEVNDHILVAVRNGGTPESVAIMAMVGHDEGMLELECR